MSKDQLVQDLLELREEAAQARQLAGTFKGAAVRDLLTYASALEREAAELETGTVEPLRSGA